MEPARELTPASGTPWGPYRFIREVVPADEHRYVHLHNLAITELLFDARNTHITVFEEAVWTVDPPAVIAVARSVHLVVRVDAPGAVELPVDVVQRFESYEGRPLS